MKNKLDTIIGELNKEERKMLLKKLQEIIGEEFTEENKTEKEIDNCPHCGSVKLWKAGKYKNYQRYKCKDCSKQFTAQSNLIFVTTKLELTVWLKYIECIVDKLSLRASASKVGVGLKTSFFMRHRILECLIKHTETFRVNKGNGAEIDECFLRENFKGNHKRSTNFFMPRAPKKRGTTSSYQERICILSGINDNQDVFFSMVGRGPVLEDEIHKVLDDKIEDGSIINTDKHIQYKKAFIKRNITHNRYDSKDRSEGVINNVNSLHSRLKSFLYDFHGVSTRRLKNYLSWFMWLETFKKIDSHCDKINLLYKQTLNGYYQTTIRQYSKTPYPFFDYYKHYDTILKRNELINPV